VIDIKGRLTKAQPKKRAKGKDRRNSKIAIFLLKEYKVPTNGGGRDQILISRGKIRMDHDPIAL